MAENTPLTRRAVLSAFAGIAIPGVASAGPLQRFCKKRCCDALPATPVVILSRESPSIATISRVPGAYLLNADVKVTGGTSQFWRRCRVKYQTWNWQFGWSTAKSVVLGGEFRPTPSNWVSLAEHAYPGSNVEFRVVLEGEYFANNAWRTGSCVDWVESRPFPGSYSYTLDFRDEICSTANSLQVQLSIMYYSY